jgi:maltokinase
VFLTTATDGWALATASVRDLFAEGDLHADEVGGDFAGEAHRLGATTARIHETLADVLPTSHLDTEDLERLSALMLRRLDEAVTVVPELRQYGDALREHLGALRTVDAPVPIQRIHGDFHLGQALRTVVGWKVVDFEGEPARSLAERTALDSPLRDVAGMLRSFDYAARHLLVTDYRRDDAAYEQIAYRSTEWMERNRDAFCDGYAEAASFDPRDQPALMTAYETDKMIYEVVYEAQHRPSWLSIPLGAVERLVATLT